MNRLVQRLYEAVPEFKQTNDPFFDEFDYTVYGCFGQFLEDLVQIDKYGSIKEKNSSQKV